MQYKAIIFDLDGTLLDSMGVWKEVDSKFIKKHSISPPNNLNQIMKTLSFEQSALYFINTFSLNMSVKEVTDEFKSMVEQEYNHNIQLKPYVVEFLQKHKDKKICLATATNEELAVSALRRLDIMKYFDFVITCTDVGEGKEKPDIFLKAAERLGFNPNEILVVEDSLHAVITAHNAEFLTLGIYDKSSSDDEIEMRKICDNYIMGYEELA